MMDFLGQPIVMIIMGLLLLALLVSIPVGIIIVILKVTRQ
jgi:hypothetical protein